MIDNKFLYFQTHDAFNEQLDGGNISQGSIAFIEDSSTIWTHGKEYADTEGVAYIGDAMAEGDDPTASFNAYSDTVWNKN